MKTTIFILIFTFSISLVSQDKKKVSVDRYNIKTNVISIEGVDYKVLQINHNKKRPLMSENQYNRYNSESLENRVFENKKVIRIKPLGTKFFEENYLIEYWVCQEETIILMQKVNNSLKLIEKTNEIVEN